MGKSGGGSIGEDVGRLLNFSGLKAFTLFVLIEMKRSRLPRVDSFPSR